MFKWTQKLNSKWAYGCHEEQFDSCDCDSREDAIKQAQHDYGEDYETFYIGKVYSLEYDLDATELLEQFEETVCENISEWHGEMVADVTRNKEKVKELQEALTLAFKPWTAKYLDKSLIDDIEEVKNPLWKEVAD